MYAGDRGEFEDVLLLDWADSNGWMNAFAGVEALLEFASESHLMAV